MLHAAIRPNQPNRQKVRFGFSKGQPRPEGLEISHPLGFFSYSAWNKTCKSLSLLFQLPKPDTFCKDIEESSPNALFQCLLCFDRVAVRGQSSVGESISP